MIDVFTLITECQTKGISIQCDSSGCAVYKNGKGIWIDKDMLRNGREFVNEYSKETIENGLP